MGSKTIVQANAADLVCIRLDVHIWSGRRHLDKTDLIHANPEFNKLPEKDLANMGSVKICDPDRIKAFQSLKNKAETLLDRAGLPILGAVGVPSKKYPEIYDALMEIQAEYEQLAIKFVADFDANVNEWKLKHMLKHPEWESLFRELPTAAHVGGRLSFDFHPIAVSAPSADASRPELNSKFEKQVGGLKGELLSEVAKEADSFVMSLFAPDKTGVTRPREYVTPKTLGPLQRAAAKLSAFAFIDPEIGPLSDLLADLLSDMPDLGRIDGQKLLMLASVARMMMDQKGITTLSSIAFNGGTANDLVVRTDVVNTQVAPDQGTSLDDLMIPTTETLSPPSIKVTTEFDSPTEAMNVPQTPVTSNEEYDLCSLL